ncbi:MAG TPA: type 1 glutamine amidotransferase domain-containing protein [Cyclobacteriaceae bacterium]|nr:type 1 glutamine amidotransferase domain-containing protein [Cyclobacteriaceae bacterium]
MKHKFVLPFFFAISLFANESIAQNSNNKKILFVLTSHNKLGNTGKPTGFWIEEFATPYYFFTDKGFDIVVATPEGGQAPIDPKSNEPSFQTAATKRYFNDAATQRVLAQTKKLNAIKHTDYIAVFYPGGHGPMWDLANDANSINLINQFYESNRPVAFVCHGPAALVNVKGKGGKYLIDGKRITSFCNTEEDAVQLSNIVPFSLEGKLTERGAKYVKGADWGSFVVEDGNLITGQNPQSSEEVAQKLLNQINKK